MSVNVKIQNENNSEISYPILMQDTQSDLVILFINEKSGTIINPSERYSYHTGDYVTGWAKATNKCEWRKFDGQVFLRNV